jgi:fatty-acyl-CoA synthase
MSGAVQAESTRRESSAAKTWLRALELTARIPKQRERIFPTVIEEAAGRLGDAPALLSDRESLTYRGLSERANQYARWALGQGLRHGDVVCLLMPNRPEYMALWLGITSVGVVVALLNTNLTGASLAHSIDAASPKQIIVDAQYRSTLEDVVRSLQAGTEVWIHGSGAEAAEGSAWPRIDEEIASRSGEPLRRDERRAVFIEDLALLIYTSGTTGLPKAAKISHARIMQWTHWFAGMMEVTASDRMYTCLPMYHSVGGVQAPGALLAAGGAVVIREKFSASAFWSDIVCWDCTLFQYIGELCRYLLHSAVSAAEGQHRLRLACGNGMAAEVWEAFQTRFHVPRILEFYAATEGNLSLFNVEGKVGSIGHIPSYLAHRFSPALARFDHESGELVRDEQGFCVRCAPGEAGEALGKMVEDVSRIGSRFDGYTSTESSERRILRDVFEAGDAWFRTGDLMRKDEAGFFYFVDRIGDTFRWKGENVATSEVAAALAEFPGVRHANVYGVAVPGAEGRAGMAMVVAGGELDLIAFHRHVAGRLPAYARPLFLRLGKQAAITGTFKYSKTELVRQGYNPMASEDALYFDNPGSAIREFIPLDGATYERIQNGGVRL